MLSSYAKDNIIVMLTVGVILIGVGVYFFNNKFIAVSTFIAGGLLILFTLWFFRDPERKVPIEALNDASLIVSPADGTILEIVEEEEKHYLHNRSKRISIFLSPLNVHVNRCPVSGFVEFYRYNKGDYIIANHPKSSELNEQSHIGVKTEFGKVFFKQIVGVVARRLVCEIKEQDTIKVGERFGMMKFGSRMDIAVDTNTELYVKIGDKVVAGETIIGKLKILGK